MGSSFQKNICVFVCFSYHSHITIDILLVQEHNVKDISVLSYLSNFTEIVLNPTTNLKDGAMICINKKTDVKLLTKEMDSSGRIVAIASGHSCVLLVLVHDEVFSYYIKAQPTE